MLTGLVGPVGQGSCLPCSTFPSSSSNRAAGGCSQCQLLACWCHYWAAGLLELLASVAGSQWCCKLNLLRSDSAKDVRIWSRRPNPARYPFVHIPKSPQTRSTIPNAPSLCPRSLFELVQLQAGVPQGQQTATALLGAQLSPSLQDAPRCVFFW